LAEENVVKWWILKLQFLYKKTIYLVVGLTLAFSLPSYSKTTSGEPSPRAALTAGESGQVTRVIDGDSLVLAGGLKVSLSAIQAPRFKWEGRYEAWPLADEARETLRALVAGKTVKLFYGGDKRDRYGRAIAQIYTLDANGEPDIWLQEAMITAGMARVYSWQGQRQDTEALYGAESKARSEQRGIWDVKTTKGFYDVRKPDPDPLAQYVDSVQIIEGVIIKIADVRRTIYLNFGSDYKTDFTIAIPKKSRKVFKKAAYDPLTLTGARVRVRGYVELYGGPIIWLNDPERLEVLD
jgi:endonuclease YncB( thermonuclease family)